jgi:hypothetical protein
MNPLQVASYITACAPWVPTVLGLRTSLIQLREQGAWPRLTPSQGAKGGGAAPPANAVAATAVAAAAAAAGIGGRGLAA